MASLFASSSAPPPPPAASLRASASVYCGQQASATSERRTLSHAAPHPQRARARVTTHGEIAAGGSAAARTHT
jgi:hypothetical protein